MFWNLLYITVIALLVIGVVAEEHGQAHVFVKRLLWFVALPLECVVVLVASVIFYLTVCFNKPTLQWMLTPLLELAPFPQKEIQITPPEQPTILVTVRGVQVRVILVHEKGAYTVSAVGEAFITGRGFSVQAAMYDFRLNYQWWLDDMDNLIETMSEVR